ncbi:RNA polymerase sigma factor [Alphaproteobacteria bacterium KMM 3653]|uniref:RNA polymerase sigma factor n=2 Tax=Harenicola maris TaxID=2841044 RepID=A0AAP2G541_9RHOB|nr:RNA polymerase sigma factor [Harenicola maris]
MTAPPPDIRSDLVALLPRLRRFALTLTRNGPDADDLVQATCTRALERAHQWAPETNLAAWTYTMARNLWISDRRRASTRMGAGQVDAAEAGLMAPHGPADALRGSQLMDQIMALPEGFATTLLLVSVEGHSYAEAAAVLDIPIGTVMSRMAGARKKLRAALTQEEAGL